MTKNVTCQHEASKLTYSKMFVNDNGGFGGQTFNILLDCECGSTVFIYSYRGNVPKEYIKPNLVIEHLGNGKTDHINLKQQEIW